METVCEEQIWSDMDFDTVSLFLATGLKCVRRGARLIVL